MLANQGLALCLQSASTGVLIGFLPKRTSIIGVFRELSECQKDRKHWHQRKAAGSVKLVGELSQRDVIIGLRYWPSNVHVESMSASESTWKILSVDCVTSTERQQPHRRHGISASVRHV